MQPLRQRSKHNYNDIIGLTQDNFLGSNVFVDNVGPKISLDGSDPYYLVHNFSINIIPTPTISVNSNNPNSAYAKTGDNLSIGYGRSGI